MQQLEPNKSSPREKYLQLYVLESKELNGKERSAIDFEYGKDSFDLYDNDEKALLSDQLTPFDLAD
ncbi:conserved hypothetical protein [Ricinus communis]|uniref:Uncharacterized protein n=1 Tax=Ricinus communis TaxID=3988 RepID=B9T4N3_RICCO|nr:conserved hypothetical protein [Ricinus communis]